MQQEQKTMFLSGGEIYVFTSLRWPLELRERARAANLNVSQVFLRAVRAELKKIEGGNNGKKTKEK